MSKIIQVEGQIEDIKQVLLQRLRTMAIITIKQEGFWPLEAVAFPVTWYKLRQRSEKIKEGDKVKISGVMDYSRIGKPPQLIIYELSAIEPKTAN